MTIDKFGRELSGPKGSSGKGFRSTPDGNYDIENKLLRNVANAIKKSDAVNLGTLIDKIDHIIQVNKEAVREQIKQLTERHDRKLQEFSTEITNKLNHYTKVNQEAIQEEIRRISLEVVTDKIRSLHENHDIKLKDFGNAILTTIQQPPGPSGDYFVDWDNVLSKTNI